MSKRIYSLDVLRSIAIIIMLFLDAPPDKIYPILMHAEWAGLTVPDVALPLFAFAMGAGAAISMSKRPLSTQRILKRTALMFAVGLFLNFLPSIINFLFVEDFTIKNFFDASIVHGRLFGIIQRLAVTYLLGVLLVRAIKNDVGIFIAAVVLLALSSLGYHIYAPDNPFATEDNISRAVDYIFPGANHIYTPTHDPEGLYGSISTTASVLFGYLAGRILIDNAALRDKIFLMGGLGIALLIAGGLWSQFDIISKKLWTTPYTLINAGGDFLVLALFTKLFAISERAKKLAEPFDALGMNPLFFFVANNFVLTILVMLPKSAEHGGIYLWLYRHTTQGLISTEFGATLFCVIWCLLWFPIAELFKRFNIVIKL